MATFNSTVLSSFESISLKEMDRVKLMNRIDSKYWTDLNHFDGLLSLLKNDYLVLEESDERVIKYKTTYYDTEDDMLYMHHHNKKERRFKIRKRSYVATNLNFLEIKYKREDGRTVKERIKTTEDHHRFTIQEREFIEVSTGESVSKFLPKLESKFQRITLVNKLVPERVTIDVSPVFKTKEGKLKLHNLVIIEIKNDGASLNSFILELLEKENIKQTSFSKYCIGRALLDPTIKQQNFETEISRLVERIYVEILPEEQLLINVK